MNASDIRNVLIVGAGTMGRQIACLCAVHGYTVTLFDTEQNIIDDAFSEIEKIASIFFLRNNPDGVPAVMNRISGTTEIGVAAADADIISESIPENPKLKGRVFSHFNKVCPPKTIFTSNTSTLLPSMFAKETGRPERFAALHFHDVRTSNLVDIMPHPGTDPEIVRVLEEFASSLGQTSITLLKENSGYVFNAMLSSLFTSALSLASKGVTSIYDIDRSWMAVMNTQIGPFGIMDQVGISTVFTIVEYWAKKTGDPQATNNADFLRKYVDAGHLGIKTKKGFYDYPNPAYASPDFLSGQGAEDQTKS
jgi:3-hydroxybutyryl-CoA dehydrogenase